MDVNEALAALEHILLEQKGCLDERVVVYNRIVALAADYLDIPHPVTRLQLVRL